jgi:hypothetical protein
VNLKIYDLGFSFFPLYKARSETPETLTTLNRQPGISPFDLPRFPNPDISTSSFSSTKLRQPSLGTKQAIFLPFLMSWTRTPLRIAELGCFASRPLHHQCEYKYNDNNKNTGIKSTESSDIQGRLVPHNGCRWLLRMVRVVPVSS